MRPEPHGPVSDYTDGAVAPVTVDLTAYVVFPYPEENADGISGVRVTCLSCSDGQSVTTDNEGAFTLTKVTPPIRIRAEKAGYETVEDVVRNSAQVILGHEWPRESAGSFRRLSLPYNLKLLWGEEGMFSDQNWHGRYSSRGRVPVAVVAYKPDRRSMLSTMEHELRHAHQDMITTVSGRGEDWERTTDEGQKWLKAIAEDHRSDRRLDRIDTEEFFTSRSWESEAEFYSWWIRSEVSDRHAETSFA